MTDPVVTVVYFAVVCLIICGAMALYEHLAARYWPEREEES